VTKQEVGLVTVVVATVKVNDVTGDNSGSPWRLRWAQVEVCMPMKKKSARILDMVEDWLWSDDW
jgi:hypothetical protein